MVKYIYAYPAMYFLCFPELKAVFIYFNFVCFDVSIGNYKIVDRSDKLLSFSKSFGLNILFKCKD